MKAYVDQIFYEGLGTSLYIPVEESIKKLKNKKLSTLLIKVYKFIYFLVAISIAVGLFYVKI